jgi:hypothetical protein
VEELEFGVSAKEGKLFRHRIAPVK